MTSTLPPDMTDKPQTGRPLAPERMEVVSIRLTAAQKEALKRIGHQAIRDYLDSEEVERGRERCDGLTDDMLRYAMSAIGTGSPADADRFRLFWRFATEARNARAERLNSPDRPACRLGPVQ